MKQITLDNIDRKIEVRLRDMKSDPHEKTHCTNDPERAADLEKMSAVFKRWFPEPGRLVFNKNKKKNKKNR